MTKTHAGVSIIIPHFERIEFLSDAINSIGPYLRSEDEIVVVDDGSKDATFEILSEFLARVEYTSNVKLLKHDKNLGGGAARNTAVRASRNDWIYCLDSDNIASINLVPILQDFASRNGVDVVAPEQTVYFDSNPLNPTHSWKYSVGEFSMVDHMLSGKIPSSSGNYLYTKESWARAGGYPQNAGALDSWGFGFMQVATGSKMVVAPDTYYLHRYGHASYWSLSVRRRILKMRRDARKIVMSQRNRFPSEYIGLLDKRQTWPKLLSKQVLPEFQISAPPRVGVEMLNVQIQELSKAQSALEIE